MSHQDTEQSAKMKINPPVFIFWPRLFFLIVGFAALFPGDVYGTYTLKPFRPACLKMPAGSIYPRCRPDFTLSVTFMGCPVSGDIKLGPDHARPAYSYISPVRHAVLRRGWGSADVLSASPNR